MNFYDPLVQFSVNAIITVLGIALTVFVTIWVYRRQQTKTEFSYDVISDAPIASINERALDKVELFINNKPIKDARILVIQVWNSGRNAIEPRDFQEPVTITFAGNNVVSCEVSETEPQDLIDANSVKNFVSVHSDYIELPKFLLNPKESIKLNLIVTGAKTDVAVRSRITAGKVVKGKAVKQKSLSDLRTISLRDYAKVVGFYLLPIAFSGLFLSLLYVLNLVWSVLPKSIPPNITLTLEIILLLVCAVLMIWFVIYVVVQLFRIIYRIYSGKTKIRW